MATIYQEKDVLLRTVIQIWPRVAPKKQNSKLQNGSPQTELDWWENTPVQVIQLIGPKSHLP